MGGQSNHRNGTRRRKQKRSVPTETDTKTTHVDSQKHKNLDNTSSSLEEDDHDNKKNNTETLWQTFTSHPLIRIAPLIFTPYLLSLSYLYILLQRPDYVNFLNLRPAVGVSDPRQVLIVGSMSSGTTQIVSEFKSAFGGKLEIGHEHSDSEWAFVRDGTVSWFHAIRFMTEMEEKKKEAHQGAKKKMNRWFSKEEEKEGGLSGMMAWQPNSRLKLALAICGADGNSDTKNHFENLRNMGFHPSMYRQSKLNCSVRHTKWDKCWMTECMQILLSEYGCETTNESNNEPHDCEIKFQTKLMQVRNPLRVMESLMTKFCPISNDDGTRKIDPSFELFANGLFAHPGTQEEEEFSSSSCLHKVAIFVLSYHQVLLSAKARGEIHAMYQIENSSICDVVERAGFMDEGNVVYPPNRFVAERICKTAGGDASNDNDGVVRKQMAFIGQEQNLINAAPSGSRRQLRLTWKDIHHAGGDDLETSVKNLLGVLGYNITNEEE